MADERVLIGAAPSNQSYLRMDTILEAAKELGVGAIHPGYGFLSENRQFSRQVKDAGMAFVGPEEHAIEVMGDKIASKVVAQDAGVNIIPGFNGVVEVRRGPRAAARLLVGHAQPVGMHNTRHARHLPCFAPPRRRSTPSRLPTTLATPS